VNERCHVVGGDILTAVRIAAIIAMHEAPGRRWTVQELAKRIGLSRSDKRSTPKFFQNPSCVLFTRVPCLKGHPHGFVESVKADKVLPAGTTSKPSPAASPEMTLPFPEYMVPPAFAVQSCVPVAASSA
jgi:hypothetical protein